MSTEGWVWKMSLDGDAKTAEDKGATITGVYRRSQGSGSPRGVLLVLLALALLVRPGPLLGGDTSQGETARLVSQRCGVCHKVSRVCKQIGSKAPDGWETTVTRMRDKGAVLDENELSVIVAYLSTLERALPPLCP